jgi:hypothetical protein
MLVDEVEMKELHLHGQRFTWSSGTHTPTQTKIDHVFSTKDWEILHSNCHLQARSTSVSDTKQHILVQKQFVVSAGNRSLVLVIGSDTLCVIQKMAIFCVG